MQKLKSIGTLAGGIAHDFNNTLTGLFGNISLAKCTLSKDHPGFKFLEKAEQSMNRATRLTSQLLTFAKGGEPIKEDVSLAELVEEVARFDLSGSNVMPVFEQDEDLWIAKVDYGQIQQVISNLTTNANQAMPDGGRLYITLENANIQENAVSGLNQKRYIKVTVRDEGTGIDQKHLDRIFDPYFSTKQTGSGLGLATVYSIINKHGGHISVDSEFGKGTTFTLYLPVSESQQLPETKQPATELSTIERTARILVMDDDELIHQLVTEMLKQRGFSVETVADGKQAIERYKQSQDIGEPFDVVIMDLTIPGGIGGKEAIKDILEINPEAKVIVSSGYANDPVMANYTEYGFKGIVEKPYTMSQLWDVLSRVLKEGDK
jgi:CheY-like chemotaxis protein